MKLALAAPASGLPFLSIAFGSQASFVHLVMKLLSAAPASGLLSFPTALLEHVSCATAALMAKIDSKTTRENRFICGLPSWNAPQRNIPGAAAV
jgi:hypothetical protein